MAGCKIIGSGRCPRSLTSMPTEPCPEALKAIAAARDGKEAGCPWFISDMGSSNGCFFSYMAQNHGTPTADHKIAQLLLIPDAEVKRIFSNFKRRSDTMKKLLD